MIVTGFSISDTADVKEVKGPQGEVLAVAVAEPIKEIKVDGMRTGAFALTVGGLATIAMPEGHDLGATTICTNLATTYAAQEFEKISATLKSYVTAMSVAA